MGLENISDAAIEAFQHAIGSGCPGAGEAMLYTRLLAQQVQLMAAAGRSRMTGKQRIGELFTVVGEQPGYLDRTGLCKAFKNALAPAAVLAGLICTNTQRVALSMATNK